MTVRLDFYFPIPAKTPRPPTPPRRQGGARWPKADKFSNELGLTPTPLPGRRAKRLPPLTRIPQPRHPVPQHPQPSGIPVTTAGGSHLFPSRTQKLSLLAPMVLPGRLVGESVVAGIPLGCAVSFSCLHARITEVSRPLRRTRAGLHPGASAGGRVVQIVRAVSLHYTCRKSRTPRERISHLPSGRRPCISR